MQNSHLPTVTPKPSRKTKKQTTKPQKRRNKQQKTTKHYSRKAKISKDQNQRSHFATHDRFLPPTTLQNHNAVHDGADHRQWEARVYIYIYICMGKYIYMYVYRSLYLACACYPKMIVWSFRGLSLVWTSRSSWTWRFPQGPRVWSSSSPLC